MRTFLFSMVLIAYTTSFAQTDHSDEMLAGPEWFDGSLMLTSGKELRGLIKYNDKTDIVSVENGQLSKSFTARHVRAFEFFDEVNKQQRIFYSVEIEDRIYNVKRPLFFEVLADLKDFALVSKVAPIRIDKREYATPAMFNPATGHFSAGRYYGYPSTISYTETLFLLSKEGEMRPIIEISQREIDGMFIDRSITKNRILDEEAFKRFTAPHYGQLMHYAKKNDLSLKEKPDVIALLQYYKELAK
jgi:hypothetical protein